MVSHHKQETNSAKSYLAIPQANILLVSDKLAVRLSSRLDFTSGFGCSLIQFPSSEVNKKTQNFQISYPQNKSVPAR
jgi:hypothetical protein